VTDSEHPEDEGTEEGSEETAVPPKRSGVEKPAPEPAQAAPGAPKAVARKTATLEREVVVPKDGGEPIEGRNLGFWHQLTALRRATPSWLAYLLGAICLVLVFALWWWATRGEPEFRTLKPTAVPSPSEALDELKPLWDRGLDAAIIASFRRVVFGFGLAILVGVGFGIVAASLRPVQAFFRPMVMFGRSIPLAALIPLTGALFGYSDQGKILFIFIATVPFVFSDTVAAILTIPERYVDTARTLGASRFQVVTKVLVPLALPDIFTGVRFLFGLAFGYIMLAESIILEKGLGSLIQQSFSRGGEPGHVFLLLIIIALMAYVIDRLLLFFQRGLFPYRQDL
jgi:ABC-type nitrate/sulfonate/bicarbonate transport system permease component